MNVKIALLLLATVVTGGKATEARSEVVPGMAFVPIKAGCFDMGRQKRLAVPVSDAWTQLGYRGELAWDEHPKHRVCLDAFQIGRTELRADEWLFVMGEPPPRGAGDEPAAGMSWQQARSFVARLNARSGDGFVYRLPTEAEWEYACQAGLRREGLPELNGESALARFAWYNDPPRVGERLLAPKPVGRRQTNPWGTHDMLGNVWEWVDDAYRADGYRLHALFNPRVSALDGPRVIRGGSYRSESPELRCGNRGRYPADGSLDQIGLRLVRAIAERRRTP